MNPAYDFNSSSSSSHFFDLNEHHRPGHEQYGLIINHAQPLPYQQATASSSACPPFFAVRQDYESWNHTGEYLQKHMQKVDPKISVPVQGSSAGHVSSASSYQPTDEDSAKDHIKMVDHENRSTSTNGHGSMKWMSSKMRVMRKVMPSNISPETELCIPAKSINDMSRNLIKSADHWNSSTAEIIRVCSDCNTTRTPLWRGGPKGPKSLCNACGIRRRKAKKAMALAASAQNNSDSVNIMQYNSSTEAPKIHNVEKILSSCCQDATQYNQTNVTSKLSFEDFTVTLIDKKSNELFPRDEEEAAILLMALSCGRIHR